MKGEDMMFNEIKNASIYSIYIYAISIISQYTVSSLMRKKLLVEINNCKFERMYTCSKRENDYAMFGNMIAIACYACYTSNSKRFSWCNNLPTFDGQKEQERFAILHWGGPDAHTEPIEIKTPSEVEKWEKELCCFEEGIGVVTKDLEMIVPSTYLPSSEQNNWWPSFVRSCVFTCAPRTTQGCREKAAIKNSAVLHASLHFSETMQWIYFWW